MERVGKGSICILHGEEEGVHIHHRNQNRVAQELDVLLELLWVSQDEEPERRFGPEMDATESQLRWTFRFPRERLLRLHRYRFCDILYLRDRCWHWERYDYLPWPRRQDRACPKVEQLA